MHFLGVESSFWLNFLLLMSIVVVLFVSFDVIMRKVLHIKKRSSFSYHHINALHKKVDWTIRGVTIAAILIGGIINLYRLPSEPIFILQPYLLLFVGVFAGQIVTALMEWKYEENRNAYIFTILQTIFFTVVLLLIYLTDFFGLV